MTAHARAHLAAAWTDRNRAGLGIPRRKRACQLRCYPVPGRVRAGMAVEQHHRLPLAAVPHAERHVTDIDSVQMEATEHGIRLPRALRGEPLE